MGIDPVKSEQSDLFGTGNGIVVTHINRRIGFETFCQITAGSLVQFRPADPFGVNRVNRGEIGSPVLLHNGNFTDLKVGFEDNIHRSLVMDVQRLGFISHKTKYQHVLAFALPDGKRAISVGDCPLLCIFPINIYPWQGLNFSIIQA